MSHTVPMTLTEFLLARYAEVEAVAKVATPGPWYWEEPADYDWPQADQSLLTRHRGNGEDYDPSVLSGWGYDASGIEGSDADRAHIALHDPTRVLADVAAKRRIVGMALSATSDRFTEGYAAAINSVLHELAALYADHKDYREEWKP